VIDPATLSIFVGAVMLLLLSPGPNMAFVISHGARYGWRGGVASGLGIGLADLILTALTAMGVTALVASWPPAFDLIRYAGGLYLLWLAFKVLQKTSASGTSDVAQVPLKTLLIRAMLNSLLNPKALLFFMVFLPQFVNAQRGAIAVQLVLLGMVLTLVSGVFHTLLGVFGSTVSRLVSSTSTFAKWQSLGLATVLLLLAVRLVLMTRPA
jgi:threonine/homoserine/homoserine lactone efflux protein